MELERKLDNLKTFFNNKKVVVAFSGGADARFWLCLLKLMQRSLSSYSG
jgi:PP-loop superfamily ATP-utilizing enzyme